MKTKLIPATDGAEIEYAAAAAAEIIKSGGLAALPTETVYGLGANALDERAVSKIFAAKGRPQDNPLIVHVNGMKMAEKILGEVPVVAYRLCEMFWPGPLTLIMKKGAEIPDAVTCGLDTVGVRMPDNPVFLETITKAGVPIAAPSANTSGKPSPTSAQHVMDDLSGKIDVVIDGGSCRVGIESTVLDISKEVPVILRPGAVTLDDLQKVIPVVSVAKSVLSGVTEKEAPLSPGMKYTHYSPEAEIVLVSGSDEEFAKFISSAEEEAVVVCYDEDVSRISRPYFAMGKKEDYAAQAAEIFSILREIDKTKAKKAYVRAPSIKGVGLALYNRLIRAASFNIIFLKD